MRWRSRPDWDDLINRQMKLLADVEPGPAGVVKAAVVFSGIAAAAGPTFVDLGEDALRQHLADAGRHTLGLRTPRRLRPEKP